MREFNYTMKKALVVGLRKTDKNKRGRQALVQSTGMVPVEGALSAIEALSEIDLSVISPAPEFPYPQLFELNQLTLVCTATQIYELESDGVTLTLKIDSLNEGHVWSVADFHNFLMLTNGKQVVYRDGETKTFSANDPYGMSSASGVCNYNGQILVAAPNVVVPDPS